MPDEPLPFDLISRLPAGAGTGSAADRKRLLERRRLPAFLSNHAGAASRYQPSDELLQAINMTIHTGSPLLLTGEPGTGKTQAADFIAAYFGINVYKFLVKSTSTAQDLMYEFDAVGYLHWAQAGAVVEDTQAVRRGFLHKRALWQAYDEKEDAVVLIDEIDKAPRDFPNDLLHELDQHSFPHPFDQRQIVRPASGRPPIVIVTSNEERRLPDAFLRRCIFHRIELTAKLIEAAVESMARPDGSAAGPAGSFPNLDPATRAAARARFWEIRQRHDVEKKPATAELMTWLAILSALRVNANQLDCRLQDLPGIGALIKDEEDRKRLS